MFPSGHHPWRPLFEWLTENFPDDVPMPSLPGTKRPMYSHASAKKGSSSSSKPWTWDDVDFFLQYQSHKQSYDIGILLRDLCVVDIDSEQLCQDFEARFPVLTKAPCESTTKGRHYYFKRSYKADKHGYYDGRAQVVHGIDFKTVCKSGTSGYVVTAPSQGKSWLRAPWDTDIQPIPDDLLAAVSRPQHQSVTATLMFPDASTLSIVDNTWLARFDYFAPWFEQDLLPTTTQCFPVGISTAAVMDELLWMCEHNRLQRWPTNLAAVRQLADYLGVPTSIQHLLCSWHPSSICARIEALDRICPSWAKLSVEPGDELYDVTEHIDMLSYEPLKRDEQWLFHTRDLAEPAYHNMLRQDPLEFAQLSLPPPVLQLLQKHRNLVLAGGAALALASDCVQAGSDYDLFLWGATKEQTEAIQREFMSMPGTKVASQTGAAVSVVWGADIVIQLITWMYSSALHVLDSFDLAPCKVAFGRFGADDEALRLLARPIWFESMRHMACWVDFGCWSDASVARILKYYAKGFDVVVPGLNRKAFSVRDPTNFPVQRGISNLFKIEALTNACLRPGIFTGHAGIATERPTYDKLHAMLRRYCGGTYKHSAYAELVPVPVFAHIVSIIVSAGMVWLGLGQPRRQQQADRKHNGSIVWKAAPASGCLFPASPCYATAFKLSVLRNGASVQL